MRGAVFQREHSIYHPTHAEIKRTAAYGSVVGRCVAQSRIALVYLVCRVQPLKRVANVGLKQFEGVAEVLPKAASVHFCTLAACQSIKLNMKCIMCFGPE